MGVIDVAVDSASAQTLFMVDRAAQVVMADPASALIIVNDDNEMRCAIGPFIDNFKAALAIYVMRCPPDHERDSRLHAAWSHAIHLLSDRPPVTSLHAVGSMLSASSSETEANMFWRRIFERALPHVKFPDSKINVNQECPIIPTELDP